MNFQLEKPPKKLVYQAPTTRQICNSFGGLRGGAVVNGGYWVVWGVLLAERCSCPFTKNMEGIYIYIYIYITRGMVYLLVWFNRLHYKYKYYKYCISYTYLSLMGDYEPTFINGGGHHLLAACPCWDTRHSDAHGQPTKHRRTRSATPQGSLAGWRCSWDIPGLSSLSH